MSQYASLCDERAVAEQTRAFRVQEREKAARIAAGLEAWRTARNLQAARATPAPSSAPVPPPSAPAAPAEPVDINAALRALAPNPDAVWGSLLEAIVDTAPKAVTPGSNLSALNYGGLTIQAPDGGAQYDTDAEGAAIFPTHHEN